MKKLLITFLLFPSILFSQSDTSNGINFEQGLTWEQVKLKAKAENKYIFLDCYATWCVPCKQMDKNVYTNDTVATYMNSNSINVKMQFDKTEKDNDQIRSLYETADSIKKKYPLQGYPSFLFFDPDGNLLYKKVGYHDPRGFIQMAKEAYAPERKDIYNELQSYRFGKRDYIKMSQLIDAANELLGDKELARTITKDYKYNYLDKLIEEEYLKKENVAWLASHSSLLSSKDRLINWILMHPKKLDTIVNIRGKGEEIIQSIIDKEEINSKLYKGNEIILKKPEWKQIEKSISIKYGRKYANELIPIAKIYFYSKTHNWKSYCNMIEKILKMHVPFKNGYNLRDAVGGHFDDQWALNEIAWNLFLNCKEEKLLKKAIEWIDISIQLDSNPQYYDTKANIIYKLAILFNSYKVQEAIQTEKQALNLSKSELEKEDCMKIISKMQNREPTWKK
jgi:thioredoxin-related protein